MSQPLLRKQDYLYRQDLLMHVFVYLLRRRNRTLLAGSCDLTPKCFFCAIQKWLAKKPQKKTNNWVSLNFSLVWLKGFSLDCCYHTYTVYYTEYTRYAFDSQTGGGNILCWRDSRTYFPSLFFCQTGILFLEFLKKALDSYDCAEVSPVSSHRQTHAGDMKKRSSTFCLDIFGLYY